MEYKLAEYVHISKLNKRRKKKKLTTCTGVYSYPFVLGINWSRNMAAGPPPAEETLQ